MKYRLEIDGLRALAVLPVIFFHAGLNWFGGGYVGVDIFFVISGYLITGIIINELSEQKFSLLKFYERRARRILPALYFVMMLTTLVSWFLLPPSYLKDFGQSLVAVSFFLSNFLFWVESGYFSSASELKPLLHTWSLAIEEQFYVIFPILLLVFWKSGIKNLLLVLAVIFISSLILAHWGAANYSDFSFYMLPMRAWELMVGSFVAIFLRYNSHFKSRILNEFLSISGLILIIYSIIFFDENTPFPSIYALIPTIGTLLILLAAVPKTAVSKILSTPLIVKIGLISYSAYLFHQPILSFARHRALDEIGDVFIFLLCLLVFILAFLSYKYVEAPFRDKKNFTQKQIFIFSIVGAIFFSVVGYSLHSKNGFPERANFNDKLSSSLTMPKSDNCFQLPYNHKAAEWGCNIGSNKDKIDFILFGDSHSLALKDVFDEYARKNNLRIFFTGSSACIPFLGVYIDSTAEIQKRNNCYELNKRVSEFASEVKVAGIILSARWAYYINGGYENSDVKFISTTNSSTFSEADSIDSFRNGFNLTADYYNSINLPIYIISQPPHQNFLPEKSFFHIKKGWSDIEEVSVSRKQFEEIEKIPNEIFSSRINDIIYIRLIDEFCNELSCPIGTEQESYYYDEDHLSIAGAKKISNKIEIILAKD